MDEKTLFFGDVFEYDGKWYVFLGLTLDVIYVAKVLTEEDSSNLHKYCESQIRKNAQNTDKWLFCYVMLTTEELKDRVAQYGKPELDGFKKVFKKLAIMLSKKDLEKLKKDIVNSRVVPIGLREIVEKVEIL